MLRWALGRRAPGTESSNATRLATARQSQDIEWEVTSDVPELLLTEGGEAPLKGKAVYFLNAHTGKRAMDLDAVSTARLDCPRPRLRAAFVSGGRRRGPATRPPVHRVLSRFLTPSHCRLTTARF